jgi:hypothetical protein
VPMALPKSACEIPFFLRREIMYSPKVILKSG